MNPVEASASSAEKILLAATDLFAANHFNGVSIKEIAKKSGVNSALISYYFGGKKNLYQEVLNEQSNLFLNLIARVSSKDIAPLAKLREYITAMSEVQKLHPHRIHLIYRELLTPTFSHAGRCDSCFCLDRRSQCIDRYAQLCQLGIRHLDIDFFRLYSY
jgi:TetR/AcrR family transcriptional regulator